MTAQRSAGTPPATSLSGCTAVVTGASRGIGAATARTLVALGARVVLVARGVEGLTTLAKGLGADAIVRPCDVSDPAAVEVLADQVRHDCGGPPDILVNNAGIFRIAPLEVTPAELFATTMQVNLVAPFLVLRAFLPGMRARGSGDIVTIGSVADRVPMAENGAYSAAKYGLRAMHEVLRIELRGSGVRATLVSPAATDTPIWDAVLAESHSRTLPTRDVMLSADAVADAIAYVVTRPMSVNIDELRLSHS